MSTRISWLIILAAVTFFVLTNRARHPAEPEGRPGPDVELLLTGRYVVAVHDAFPIDSATADRMLTSVGQAAQTPEDQVCAAIVAGELDGPAAAARRFQELRHTAGSPEVRTDAQRLAEVYEHGSGTADPAARQALRQRYGWFADLALTHDLPVGDPARRAVLAPAQRMLWICGGVFLALAACGLAAVALIIVAVVLWKRGRLRPAYRPLDVPSPRFIEGFAAYLASYTLMVVAGSLLVRHTSLRLSLWASMPLPFAAAALGVVWLRWRGLSVTQLRAALGWHRGRGILREMGAGLLGYLAGLPLYVAAGLITLRLARGAGVDAGHPIIQEFGRGTRTTMAIYLVACVMAPLCEETLFRGAFYHHLRQRLAPLASALIVSVIFAALHPQGWVAIPLLGSVAVVFALIREWRGSIIASMTAHALNNGVAVTLMVLLVS